jgi:hypothetical protein
MSIAVLVVYYPGLDGDFVFDDRINIELNSDLQIDNLSWSSLQQAWFSGKTGNFGRPVAMLSFALTHYFNGPSPSDYKKVNLFIHVLNSIVVTGLLLSVLPLCFGSVRGQSKTYFRLLACIAGLIWAIHPLHVSSVLYVVQRMTLLSALFTLSGLWLYIVWRQQLFKPGLLRWLGMPLIFLLLVLGLLSKENAILLPGFILLAEFFLFLRTNDPRELRYKRFFWSAVAIGVVVVVAYIHFDRNWFINAYDMRSFTLYERLLTEARVMFIYLNWIIIPDVSQYGLFHDDILTSRSLVSPATTVYSIVGIFIMVLVSVVFRRKLPWLGFCIGFYLLGHSLESSIIPLELVYEHRNYVPAIGIVLMLVIVVARLVGNVKVDHRVKILVALSMLVFIAAMTYLRSMEWSSVQRQMHASAERHPQSARSQWGLAMSMIQVYDQRHFLTGHDDDLYQKIVDRSLRAAEVNDDYVANYLGLMIFHYRYNIAIPSAWVDDLAHRLRYSSYRVSTDSYIGQLLTCYSDANCSANAEDIDLIFRKVLLNPTVTKRARANILSGYSAFMYLQGNLEMSFDFLVEAMGLHASASGYRDLTEISLYLNRKDRAEYYFSKFKAMAVENRIEDVVRLERKLDACCRSL